ncbi:hypothetical protein [Myceligenerans pegani]|uniref:Alpha/beta hydrolase n=1 Tax=Myceligenerans pegani TaxID=2776917 RepID=A0ABR9MWW1_9MICO|nr:hypothetical protein [Myceligenerans sp. TRM 65318]MBE1875605.1 hypothetical protein [Myceligenerans sp. TRM 65318]MBE3017876.1 hypothetical protein [Myceligenerans sp. TRM 65318]
MSNVYELHRTNGDPGRVATVLPGAGYTAMGPLLYHSRAALEGLGWTVRVVEWTGRRDFDEARAAAAELLEGADAPADGATHLVIAKSLGTLAIPVAARLNLPGVWLTPVLRHDDAADVRDAVTRLEGDHLLIGGTADPLWDHDLVSGLRADFVEVSGADHSLEIPDDWRKNLETVEDVTAEIEHFAASFDVG